MKYPKVSDLVAGTATHLTVKNPPRTVDTYTGLVDQAYAWISSPFDPRAFQVPPELAEYIRAAGVPDERGIGSDVDRGFWAGEVLDAIDRAAARNLPADAYFQYRQHADRARSAYDRGRAGDARPRDFEAAKAAVLNPPGLSAKGERMYEHVRASYGGDRRGKEIAARTVLARARRQKDLLANPSPELERAAVEKFKEFHRYDPKKLEHLPASFQIPRSVIDIGRAKWVTYRSAKVDPATLKKPKHPVNYIHEHNAGVRVYLPSDRPELDELDVDGVETPVPRAYYAVEALVKLGDSLGFCVHGEHGAEDAEFEGRGKLPELLCVPDGTCLLIVQDRRDVIAMIWGGALGVFGRGIDG